MPTIKTYQVKADTGIYANGVVADDPMEIVRDLMSRVSTLQSAGVAYAVKADGDSQLILATSDDRQTEGQRALGMAMVMKHSIDEIHDGVSKLLTPPPVPTVLTATEPPGPKKVAEEKKRRGKRR